jgi:hypothetical protein
MKRLIVIAVLLIGVPACGTVNSLTVKRDIDKYDRIAFESLHAFQQTEEALWHSKAGWPTADQHALNGRALSTAYTLVGIVAKAGIDLKPGDPLPAVLIQELTDLTSAVAQIVALSQNGPAAVHAQAIDAQTQTASFVSAVQKRGR